METQAVLEGKKIKIFKFCPIVLQSVIYIFTLVLFKIFTRIKFIVPKEVVDLAKKGPIIFACNHGSEWDGIIIRVGLPYFWSLLKPMYYVALTQDRYKNSGWRQLLYGGTFFRMHGAYPTYSGKKDYSYSLQNHLEILKSGGMLNIYPEGHRTHDGLVDRFHGGVSFLSYSTNAPIIPVAISGGYRYNWIKFLLGKYRITYKYGKPIFPKDIFPQENPTVEDFKNASENILRPIILEMLNTKA